MAGPVGDRLLTEPSLAPAHASLGRRLGPTARGWLVFAGFLAASFLVYALPVAGSFGHRYLGVGFGDARLYTWDLGWWPHAIAAGLNPLHPTVIWYPSGANMAWVTGLPGPAILAWPITAEFGAVTSLNVLLTAAPALASWAAYLLCKEATGRFWPAVAGGAIFGFSTYMTGQMHGHVNLVLIFPVPLAVYLTVRYVRGELTARAYVLLTALCLVLLFFTTTEVFATFALFSLVAFAGTYVCCPTIRPRLRKAAAGIAVAGFLFAAVAAPYLWYAAHGIPAQPVRGVGYASIDALGWVLPRQDMLFGGKTFLSVTHWFIAKAEEDGSYLPPTLLLVLVLALIRGRRERTTWLLYGFAAVAALLAMGANLRVRGRVVFTAMPWGPVNRLPVIGNALPQRFTMFVWLAVALIVARWLAIGRSKLGASLSWLAVALSLLLVFPQVRTPQMHQRARTPGFFLNGVWQRSIAKGSTILIVHGGGPGFQGQEMLWQQMAGYGFNMPQAYTGPVPTVFAVDPVSDSLLAGAPTGIRASALRTWLKGHGVTHVVVVTPDRSLWASLLHAATGSDPRATGGAWVYTVT